MMVQMYAHRMKKILIQVPLKISISIPVGLILEMRLYCTLGLLVHAFKQNKISIFELMDL